MDCRQGFSLADDTYIVSEALSLAGSVRHGFTTRNGGVSEGQFRSLNLGINRGDKKEHVSRNYHIIAERIGFDPNNMALTSQVHGDNVRVIIQGGGFFEPAGGPCDALITNVQGIALIVFTADCVPILLYDPVSRCIGAVHAGWRGTANGILRKAVNMMAREYGARPGDIRAAIGPSIGRCCFEVDSEVYEKLKGAYPDIDSVTGRKEEKYYPDLKALNRSMLIRCGVDAGNVSVVGLCTKCGHEMFWSHRRDGERRGLQGAIIVMT